MAETPTEQFDALAKAATQGSAYAAEWEVHDDDEESLVDCASDTDAAFIAWCFNNRALISAALRSVESDGWVLIPMEPTKEMLQAATLLAPTWDDDASRRKYAAMIAARPLPPSPAATGE